MKTWYILVAIILVLLFVKAEVEKHQADIKGKTGERRVRAVLGTLDHEKYVLVNDIMLPNEYGTTQIDHILISVFGIFVIETKNYSGVITGKEDSEYWTQNIYGHKNQFKNPVRQNYGHIKAIETLLPKDLKIPLYSVVVFTEKAKVGVAANKTDITYLKGLKSTITSHEGIEHATFQQVQELAQIINDKRIKGIDARKQHVEDIHEKTAQVNQKIHAGICPKCGGNLVTRHGKYGDFIGCSNYPKCRFTKQQ